jgi:two-component system OmpR family sensor kinase
MNNLDLLERHRKKVAFFLAAIVLVLLYISIALFQVYLVQTEKAHFSEIIPLWLWLFVLSPFLYSALSFAACRLMHRVYYPVRESIMNLEYFTTNVNHEFKTSLAEIISSLELWEITKTQSQYTPQALNSAKRLNIILDSLMPLVEYSKSSYKKKNTDIVQIFNNVMLSYKDKVESKNISIIKDFPDSLWKHIDIWPLSICFQNIFANSLKYNQNWWEVHIKLWNDFFEIYDTGIWISTENIDKIFKRRFQEWEKSEWLGVGLSLVKSICDMYNWEVIVESEKGKYTRVKISF